VPSGVNLLPQELLGSYEVHEWRHATAVLKTDFPDEFSDVVQVLCAFRLKRSFVVNPGGNKSRISSAIDGALAVRGWQEKCFDTKITVDDTEYKSPTHSVDCFKNGVALEIEWNNKDPFYDRDLNNFRLLFDLRVVSVGIIVTRCDELDELAVSLGRDRQSYGASTTRMSKLLPRIEGGGGGGCPILVFGIRKVLYDPAG
jgi:hypothetical protein